METKYPKKIKQIMREAPMDYSILMLLDYNQKSVGANELFRRWQRDKKFYCTYHIAKCNERHTNKKSYQVPEGAHQDGCSKEASGRL